MWRITWGDNVWTEEDLTVAHMNAICLVQGVDAWEQCDPLAGPGRALGVLAVLVAQAEGRDVNDVLLDIARRPASDLLNALDIVDDPDEPPASVADVVPAPLPTKPPGQKQKKAFAKTG